MTRPIPKIKLMDRVPAKPKKTWALAFRDKDQYDFWINGYKEKYTQDVPKHVMVRDTVTGQIYVRYLRG